MVPTREIYWNIIAGPIIYLMALIAAVLLGYGIWRRVLLWRLGRPENRLDRIPRRIWGLVSEILGHRKQLRDIYPGLMHLFIFYGFSAMLIATSMIAVQEWTGIHYLKGTLYLWYSLLSDLFGLLGIIGIFFALFRRTVWRPERINTVADDWIALLLLLLVFAQGFLVEGLRIAATEYRQNPSLALWSPGGYLVAVLISEWSEKTLISVHRFNWWFHTITAMSFIGYLGYAKFSHIWYGLLNIFFQNLEPSGKLTFVDIEAAMESEPDSIETLGVEKMEQYSWKGLLDLDACTNCGRCQDVCPAFLSGVPLSPRKLIQDMQKHLSQMGPALVKPGSNGGSTGSEDAEMPAPLYGKRAEGEIPPAVLTEELWGCRTCGACQQECPVYIEHIPKMIDMRRYLVMMESKMSESARNFLKSMEDRLHPWVGAQHNREEWYEGLKVKVLGNGEKADYLFWVGCTGSMIDRNIKVTKAMAKILQAGNVDFGVLGPEEVCTGDPARRAGGEFTFQMCAKQNIATLERYGVTKIITTCPHCFNTYKNEYPDFGGKFEVIHHSQLIEDLIQNGRLKLKRNIDSIAYHDPCYLGRHNGVYEAPRKILRKISAANGYRELPRNQDRALCCGAGGGFAWMDDEPKKRINHLRLEEVKACGVKTAAISCPFCLQMFDDALNAIDPEKYIRAADIAELVAEALV